MNRVEIIAHRGASAVEHENTLAAFAKAIELGADRIETDVRHTRDGVLVLHHDPGPPGITLAEVESADLPAISRDCGYEIPTLQDALARFGDNILWDIELKEVGYERQVVDLVSGYLTPQRVTYSSFHDSVVKTIRTGWPQLAAGLILGTDEPKFGPFTRLGELYPMRRAGRCGASALIPGQPFLRYGFLKHVRGFRGPVWVWTVNEEADLRQLFATPGVGGVITDDVALAVRIRDGGEQ